MATPPPSLPLAMQQRLAALPTALRTLDLLLQEISLDEYRAGLGSKDERTLIEKVYPLERAFEVVSNYVVELARLALDELGVDPVDGVRDLEALATHGVIGKTLAAELVAVHRARNELTRAYPELGGKLLYEAATATAKHARAFAAGYFTWIKARGYVMPAPRR